MVRELRVNGSVSGLWTNSNIVTEAAGFQLCFLPLSWPDDNPIVLVFAKL